MSMELKNQMIAEYLKERFVETQAEYPGIFSYEKYDRAVIMFQDNPNCIEDLKLLVDNMIEKEIVVYIKRKEEEKRFELLLHQDVEKRHEAISYEQLRKVYAMIKVMVNRAGLKLYLAGGMVPYLLLNQNSERLHDDIDNICKLEDMPFFRSLFKQAGLYDAELDSLNFANDGRDYGFEFYVNGVPVGIYPFTYSEGILTQYSYTSSSKMCKEKMIALQDINDYVCTYNSFDGISYTTQSLEVIKKSKDVSGREKDKVDSKKIAEYGIRQNVYDRLNLPIKIKNKSASELKSTIDKKKEWMQKREFVIALSAQSKQIQQIPEEKGYQKVIKPTVNTHNC